MIIIYHPYGTWLVFFFLCYIQEGNCLSNHHALVAHIHPLLFANSLATATKTWKWKEIVLHREENTPITYLVCQKLDCHRVTSKPTCYCKLQFFHQMILLSFKFQVPATRARPHLKLYGEIFFLNALVVSQIGYFRKISWKLWCIRIKRILDIWGLSDHYQ